MRHFLFGALKRRPEFKTVQKEAGKVKTVTIIVANGKMILRSETELAGNIDRPFTRKEMIDFCSKINITEEQIDNCKSIFISLNMITKIIHYQSTKKDGTKEKYDIWLTS